MLAPLYGVQLLVGWEVQEVDEEVALLEPFIDVATNSLLVDAAQWEQRAARYVI